MTGSNLGDQHPATPSDPAGAPAVRAHYINLLRDALTMSLWDAADGNQLAGMFPDSASELRGDGRDWPNLAHTMIGVKRMHNLQFCVEDVLARDVPGDFIETGVWRGGSCIFMRGILQAYGVTDRRVWVADSFAGLPEPDGTQYPEDADSTFHLFPQLAIPMETVQDNFRRYGLLDDQVVMLKGWFRDTLPKAPIEKLAILRLDGDMYESTMDALTSLYDKVSDGGYIIVDDYSIPSCRQAIKDFRDAHKITDLIEVIDWTGVYWQKGSATVSTSSDAEALAEIEAKYAKLLGQYEETARERLEYQVLLTQAQAAAPAASPDPTHQ